MLDSKNPLINTAPSAELLALAEKFERYCAVRDLVDEKAAEPGAGMVLLTGREMELIAECVRSVGADVWRYGR